MNIGMNALQDELALQREPLTTAQQQAVQRHPLQSQALLARLFVNDALWLELVARHHEAVPSSRWRRCHPCCAWCACWEPWTAMPP